jgi:hypothetical protein
MSPEPRRPRKGLYQVHQTAFDKTKATITKDAVMSYPYNSKEFVIYTDASFKHPCVIITRGNRPIMFFRRKLTESNNITA